MTSNGAGAFVDVPRIETFAAAVGSLHGPVIRAVQGVIETRIDALGSTGEAQP